MGSWKNITILSDVKVTKEQSKMFVSWIRFFQKWWHLPLVQVMQHEKNDASIHFLNTPRKHIEFGILISAPKKRISSISLAQPPFSMRKEATEKDGAMISDFTDTISHVLVFLYYWLVVSTHLINISQIGNLPQIGVKKKNVATT